MSGGNLTFFLIGTFSDWLSIHRAFTNHLRLVPGLGEKWPFNIGETSIEDANVKELSV